MVPKGGGSFLNEVDGNLTCSKVDSVVTLHWQGKYRGPDFAPIPFELHTVTTDLLRDSKGRLIPSVVATPLSEKERGEAEAGSRMDEDRVLLTIAGGDRRSLTDLTTLLNWTVKGGKPNKAKVQRVVDRLKKGKLAKDLRLKVLRDLASIDLMPTQQFRLLENELLSMKTCYQLSANELDSTASCPHCEYRPSDESLSAAASMRR